MPSFTPCTYCGEPADTMDHVVPHSWSSDDAEHRHTTRDTCVPACRECNSLLGPRPYHTIASRAGYLADKLAKRNVRILSTPEWDEDELEDLGPVLRGNITSALREKERTRHRIANCTLRASEWDLTISDVWEALDTQ